MSDADERLFGFAASGVDGDTWLRSLRAATAPTPLGTIGSYRLLAEVSRGGQGVVFRAQQPGMSRPIAVKRLLAGCFASDEERRRFAREIELASQLHHPGIVTVYGMDEVDGLPVLAMEWVDGVPLTQWAADGAGHRGCEECLRMFLAVCGAVQHAHQHGILHRDLKPSNVLVDDAGQPRVLDFGLAQPMGDGDGAAHEGGGGARFSGTLGYASPEQLSGETARLDVRSDVYALGVLLYEMLTGQRPYPTDGGPLEHLAAVDANGPVPPSRWRVGVGREVDAIVAKAVARAPAARFASVAHLADDVRRYLSGEPVLAHPPSRRYAFAKFVKRHRAPTALAAILVLTLVAFAVTTFVQGRAIAAERDAEAMARARATLESQKAEAVLEFLLRDMLEAAEDHRDPTVRAVLDAAAARVEERFAGQPAVAARVRSTIGESYRRLGHYPEAETHLAEALRLLAVSADDDPAERSRLEESLGAALRPLGRGEESLAHLRQALELVRAQPDGWERVAQLHSDIGMTCYELQRFEDGRDAYQAALDVVREHAPDDHELRLTYTFGRTLYPYKTGDMSRARGQLDDLLEEIRARLEPDTRIESWVLEKLGLVSLYSGEGEPEPYLRDALRIMRRRRGPMHPDVAAGATQLAHCLTGLGRPSEAVPLLRESVAIAEHTNGTDGVQAAMHRAHLGRALSLAGEIDEGIEILESCTLRFSLDGPDVIPWGSLSHEFLADALAARGDLAASLALRHRVVDALRAHGLAPVILRDTLGRLAQGERDVGHVGGTIAVLDEYLPLLARTGVRGKAVVIDKLLGWMWWLCGVGAVERAADCAAAASARAAR
ncbi:MAG: serine/threonine-protein kinase [Planctomycetota bacterium]